MPESTSIVRVTDVYKTFQLGKVEVKALQGVNLEIPRGKIGWDMTSDGHAVEMLHVPFGQVLGEDRKPLKTRSGETVTLHSLLTEAVQRQPEDVRRAVLAVLAPPTGSSSDDVDG